MLTISRIKFECNTEIGPPAWQWGAFKESLWTEGGKASKICRNANGRFAVEEAATCLESLAQRLHMESESPESS